MRAADAQYLSIGQEIEFNDGRIALVEENDSRNRQIRMRFMDGSVGINQYQDLFQAEPVNPNKT